MVSLRELAPVSETLNAKSNEVNQIIADLNAKLAKLKIGLEVTTSNILEDDWEIESAFDGTLIRRTRKVYQLGYSKFDEKWELAIAEFCETQEYVGGRLKTDRHGNDETEYGAYKWIPLLQASRSLRIAALSHVEELITELHDTAQSEIEAINEARELANKL